VEHTWRALDRARRLALGARKVGGKVLRMVLQQGCERALGESLADLKSEILYRGDVCVGLEGLGLACSTSENFSPRLCQFE
jgi:hypothetical protein